MYKYIKLKETRKEAVAPIQVIRKVPVIELLNLVRMKISRNALGKVNSQLPLDQLKVKTCFNI